MRMKTSSNQNAANAAEYQRVCNAAGLHPVTCNVGGNSECRPAVSTYGAVSLPQSPFSCTLSGYFQSQFGHSYVMTMYCGGGNSNCGYYDGGYSSTMAAVCTD